MSEFWRFVSIMISLAGFLIVTGVMLTGGEALFDAVLRAIVVFVALWIVQSVLRALLGLTVKSENEPQIGDDR